MCLIVLILILPRLIAVVVWAWTLWSYATPVNCLLALACCLFLPCTALTGMYAFSQSGGNIEGSYIVLIVIGFVVDLGCYYSRFKK